MSDIDLNAAIDDVATIISGAPFPSTRSRGRARLVIDHVTPLIETAVRERIAREIEDMIPGAMEHIEKWSALNRADQVAAFDAVIQVARYTAEVARGESRA